MELIKLIYNNLVEYSPFESDEVHQTRNDIAMTLTPILNLTGMEFKIGVNEIVKELSIYNSFDSNNTRQTKEDIVNFLGTLL